MAYLDYDGLGYFKDKLDGEIYPAYVTPTASGDIASFPDGSDGLPVKNLTVNVELVQTGSGDPSPDNIRPITGWTGANVTRTGKNLWGGLKMAQDVQTANSGATLDTTNKTITFTGSDNYTYLSGIFKPDTRYSFVIFGNAYSSAKAPNIAIYYTDGTYSVTTTDQQTDGIAVLVSSSGKTVKSIKSIQQSGVFTAKYEKCGLFEGVITADDFEPYQGTTIPISFPDEAGTVYGGTLDVTSGVLTVDKKGVDMGTLSWSYTSAVQIFYANLSDMEAPTSVDERATKIISSIFKLSDYLNLDTNMPNDSMLRFSTFIYVRNMDNASASDFTTFVNGQILVYPLATPVEYTLTPEQLTTLLGTNNVWFDCGSTECTYRADPKLYVDNQLTQAIANALNA